MAKPKALPEGKESQFGRKTKRTPELEEKIFEQLQLGCTRRAACAVAGISEETFYCWMREIPEFSELVVAAENQAEAGFTNVIQKAAAAGDWRAAESWLKRRRRDDYGDSVDIKKVDDDTLIRLLEKTVDSGGETPGA